MRSRGLGAALWLLLAAACTGAPTATPGSESAAAETTETPAATASPTQTESPSPIATEEPSAEAGADEECTSDPPTAESAGWTEHTGFEEDYRFSTPSDWEELGPIPTDIVRSVSPETFERIGLPDFGQHFVDVWAPPDGSFGFNAFVIESRIDTPTDEIFPDERQWLDEQPHVRGMIDSELEACVDGSTALGFSSNWSLPVGDRYIELYLLQRNGKIFEMQIHGPDESTSELFAEILRTWEWTEPLEGGDDGSAVDGDLEAQLASTDFGVAGAMTDFVESEWEDGPPPQSRYDDTFGDSERIWIIYQLDAGVGDTVLITWNYEGEAISEEGSLEYAEDTLYAWSWMDPAPGGFPAGTYEVAFELEESGDQISVAFEVQD